MALVQLTRLSLPETMHTQLDLYWPKFWNMFKPLNAELNPICHLLALLGARLILHVSRIRVKAELTAL
jgi:hypothetical protein